MERLMRLYLIALSTMIVIAIIFSSLYFNESGDTIETSTPSCKIKTMKKTNGKGKNLCF